MLCEIVAERRQLDSTWPCRPVGARQSSVTIATSIKPSTVTNGVVMSDARVPRIRPRCPHQVSTVESASPTRSGGWLTWLVGRAHVDQQAERVWHQLQSLATGVPLLEQLHYRHEVLYFVLADHLPELMPVVYTPTVGEAIQRPDEYRGQRGLFLSIDEPD